MAVLEPVIGKRRRASVITVETILTDLEDDFVCALDSATEELGKVDCLDTRAELVANAPRKLKEAMQRLFKAQDSA